MVEPVGVDIASFQGNPNWKEAHGAGYRFAYVKTTQFPGYVNPYAILQRHDAFANGFAVGNYCYAVAKLGEPTIQAAQFVARSNIQPWHLAPFLDLEEIGSEGCTPAQLEQFAYEWGLRVNALLGIKHCVLYSDLNMLRNRIRITKRLRSIFLLDLADWTLGPPPRVPGWDMVFHQYNVNRGIPGFSGPVDHMRALVPLDTLTIHALSTRKPPKIEPAKCNGIVSRALGRIPRG